MSWGPGGSCRSTLAMAWALSIALSWRWFGFGEFWNVGMSMHAVPGSFWQRRLCAQESGAEIQRVHAESESSIPRGGSVSHWHGSELCYFTEQGLGSFQLLQWYNSRRDRNIHFSHFCANCESKLTHSERPFCREKCKFNLLQYGKRTGHEAAGLWFAAHRQVWMEIERLGKVWRFWRLSKSS